MKNEMESLREIPLKEEEISSKIVDNTLRNVYRDAS